MCCPLRELAAIGPIGRDGEKAEPTRPDPVRDFLFNEPRLVATEIVTAPGIAAIIAAWRR